MFEGPGSDRGALDELFRLTNAYRRSGPYLRLLQAIGRFVEYSPYNAALIHIQNPKASRVATVDKWRKAFRRRPMSWARPLVILRPFGPVMFVYDAADTEPISPFTDDLGEWGKSFRVATEKSPREVRALLKTLRTNCAHEGVGVVDGEDMSFLQGGYIRPIANGERALLPQALRSAAYLTALNADLRPESQIAILAHELGHLFCGHLPKAEPALWWEERRRPTGEPFDIRTVEFEAESVAYLVCHRLGIEKASEHYLAHYANDEHAELPPFSVDAVIAAAAYVETMRKDTFSPKRRKKPATST